jgi:hypothetical protein
MLNADKIGQAMDATTPRRERSSLNTAQDNTCVVSTTPFSPVYASPDDVDFQREEHFAPQFLPR